jgi:hypothetical protein
MHVQFTIETETDPLGSIFYAKNGDALSTKTLSQTEAKKTLYLLVNASGTAAPTIDFAPDGVTF